MTYFNLRKHADPEPEEEAEEEQPEEAEAEPEKKKPDKVYGPILTGLLGPGAWISRRIGPGWAWGVHVVAVWAIGYYGDWTAAGIILGWLLAVLAFVPRELKDRIAKWIEGWGAPRTAAPDEGPADAEEDAPVDPRTELIRWLDELTRTRSGIHLKELHQALVRHPQLAHLGRSEMRVWLGRHHITVDRTLRVGDVAGRSGVSRATIEALLKDLPPLAESGGTKPVVHAPELHDSPVETGVERGGEHAA